MNELMEKEAESLTQAARYERSEVRQGYSLEGLAGDGPLWAGTDPIPGT